MKDCHSLGHRFLSRLILDVDLPKVGSSILEGRRRESYSDLSNSSNPDLNGAETFGDLSRKTFGGGVDVL